jgi:hypothetical protein
LHAKEIEGIDPGEDEAGENKASECGSTNPLAHPPLLGTEDHPLVPAAVDHPFPRFCHLPDIPICLLQLL